MSKLLFRGPVLTASGYGVHARQLLRAIMASGDHDVSVQACNWGNTSYVLDRDPFLDQVRELANKHEMERQSGKAEYDVSVQVTIPNEFERMARVNIGVTAGIEVDRASPEWLKRINEKVDLLIVPSTHSRDTLANVGYNLPDGQVLRLQRPVAVVPEGFDARTFNTAPTSSSVRTFDLLAPTNFLFVGLGLDKGMGEDRKNLSHLVKWFCERFKDDRSVGLVIKGAMVNGSLIDHEQFVSRVRQIKRAVGCGEYPIIQVIHGRLSDDELAGLYRHPQVLALVSLTHGEGFGLPLLEAAACGLPVMATAWSGHLDFLSVDGKKRFVPVEHDLAEIPESAVWSGVMEKGSRWANPKEDDTKAKLKKLSLSPEKPREWAAELAASLAQTHTQERTGFQFVSVLRQFLDEHARANPRSEEEAVQILRQRFDGQGKPTLLYTMPMSAGDVYVSTAVVDSLRKKHPDHVFFFATDPKYHAILWNNPDVDRVVPWEPWMTNVPLLERVFDVVHTPNLAIQTTAANWVKRGKGRLLGDEMAHLCDVPFGDYKIEKVSAGLQDLPDRYVVVNPGSGQGQWEARNYLRWQEVVTNIKNLSGLPVVQVGVQGDPELKDVIDFRGKTSYNQLAAVVAGAVCVVGIDSVTSHLAAGHDVPQVSIYGSSYSTSTGPVQKRKGLAVLMDTPDRYGCERACYKHQCSVDREHPCVNEIEPRFIVRQALVVCLEFTDDVMDKYREVRPTLSGYTHVLNPERQGYPWRQSIASMLGFCDQVVVVDGGSDDGSSEELKAWAKEDPRLQVVDRRWDWNEPGMDGMQKAFGRAMCTGDFCWQQDVDEVVHEEDYEKVRKLVLRFPRDTNLMHLPIIELWGDGQTCRTDRHTWKWRLSRNDFRITHGINREARVVDVQTGKTYAKKGMSDGCEMIDVMDYTHLPHRGFYDDRLESLRRSDPRAFGTRMNEIYGELPSVFHYSWADIPRKVRNFRDFWEKCWSNLYNEKKPTLRFPNVNTEEEIKETARKLRVQGGEHGPAQTFILERTNPSSMREWINRIEAV